MLGRWRDESDVNFIHLYRLHRSGGPARAPEWVTAGRVGGETPERGATREADAAFREIRSALRNLVTAQEAYYADHRTYATDASSMAWSPPEDLRVDIVAAHGTGWAGVATHRRLAGVICGMAVGGAPPPGWPEGAPKCE